MPILTPRRLAASVAVLCAFLLSGPMAQAADARLIRIHTATPEDPNVAPYVLAQTFADYVNENSKTVEVKVFANSRLGETREVIEAMRLGSGAAGSTGGAAEYASFVKQLGVLGLPFEWKSFAQVVTVLNGPVGDALRKNMEAAGFKVLAMTTEWGFRNVVTAKVKVTKVEDLKGLKLRTIPTKVFVAAVNAMGANATPMNFGEVYTALQSGVLDGFEHTAATTLAFKFQEVTCCVALTAHLMDPPMLVLSMAEWRKLSPADQAVLQKGADLARDKVNAMAAEQQAKSLDALKKSGMQVFEIDTAALRQAAAPVQKTLAEEFGTSDLLARILATP